jgi:hypothetical protein
MKTNKPIQIFKPGKHTAMSGAALSFSETDLSATAAAYDPAKHEAPLVCGHPKHDDPAYGWVGALSFSDGALEANPTQVDAAFAEMVDKGSFKKISASFYAPDSPSNPVPGVYYLRHVGFLGAMPPSVKGLRNPSFADAEQGIVEFAEWDDVDNAGLWRSMRDWILGKFGQADADTAVPGYTVKNLEQSAQKELDKTLDQSSSEVTPSFTEPTPPKGDIMNPEQIAALQKQAADNQAAADALKAENATLKAQQVAFAEAESKRQTAAVNAENLAFCEELVKQGRMLPANKGITVATLNSLAQQQTVEFGEGDAKTSLLAAQKKALSASPVLVNFGEFSADGGSVIAPDNGEIARRARAYKAGADSRGENLSFAEAVDAVTAGKDK